MLTLVDTALLVVLVPLAGQVEAQRRLVNQSTLRVITVVAVTAVRDILEAAVIVITSAAMLLTVAVEALAVAVLWVVLAVVAVVLFTMGHPVIMRVVEEINMLMSLVTRRLGMLAESMAQGIMVQA